MQERGMRSPYLRPIERPMDAMIFTAPELCVVVPVLNERDNVAPLVAALHAVLGGIAWE